MKLEELWHFLIQLASTFGVNLVISIAIAVIGFKIIKTLKKWIKTSHKLDKIDSGVRSFLGGIVSISLYVVLFILVATRLGIPTTSFIAALASGFAAIGLAMQGALSNFAGGIMILLFKPFKVGDYIETPDAEGTVTDVTVVYTILTTYDNKKITIPNGTLTNSVIENYSACENRRVDLTFSTSYNNDVEQVKKILMDVLKKHPLVLSDPAPFARLSEHSDSALTYSVKAWCKTENYWEVNFDLIEAVKKAFDENKIEIPYPQMDVHIDNK